MMTATSNNNNHVFGHVAQGWEAVRSVFEQNLIDELDIGASLCVYYQGECVVNLCGGWKDPQTKKRTLYTRYTATGFFNFKRSDSCSCGIVCGERLA